MKTFNMRRQILSRILRHPRMVSPAQSGLATKRPTMATTTSMLVAASGNQQFLRTRESLRYYAATAARRQDGKDANDSAAAKKSDDSSTTTTEDVKTVPIIFVEADDSEKEVQAPIGKHLLEVAHDNNVELEGACGGELACSTCHLVFEKEIYDQLPDMLDDEEDMLDLAFEVTETSRLGCQIHVQGYMAGMKVRIPDDGF